MKTIERLKLNPIPRGANYMRWETFRMGPSYMYAHQLLYIVDGTGCGRIGDDEYRLGPGVLSTYGPGVQFEFRSDPGVPLTAATMCFSWCEVSEKQLSVRNRSAKSMEGDYREYAEEPVRIEGLPPFPFHLEVEEPYRRRLEEMFREIGSAWRMTPYAPLLILKAKAVLTELVYLLQKQFEAQNGATEPAALTRFRHFVGHNYASDIVRRDAAVAAGISESHLTGLLIRHCGSNFSEYLNRTRLKAAAELLQYSTLSVKEVAAAVGFRNCSYFVARFRERYGVSPGRARNGV
ncbi:MAG: helix-turn-helix transcriptional regulator [Lentisphaeria bacterium]|nr:helix-turn-helix transcriptional regulator [Lentisphaeria bacterium]